MNKTRVHRPLLAAASALLLAAVLVFGVAAAPDPFRGKWYSTDVDGSNQTLQIGGGPAGSYRVRYFDDGATVCGLGSEGEFLFGATARGFLTLWASGDTISGTLQVYCLESPPVPYEAGSYFEYVYDPATDTLTDASGVNWSH